MARYAVTDADGNIENVVVWDGSTPWEPGEGKTKVEVPEGVPAEPGGKYRKGKPDGEKWERAPRPVEPGQPDEPGPPA